MQQYAPLDKTPQVKFACTEDPRFRSNILNDDEIIRAVVHVNNDLAGNDRPDQF